MKRWRVGKRFYLMLVPTLLLMLVALIPLSNLVYSRCFAVMQETLMDAQRDWMERAATRLEHEIDSWQRMAAIVQADPLFQPYQLNHGGYDSFLAQQELNKQRTCHDGLIDLWYYPLRENPRDLVYTADITCPFGRFFDFLYRPEGFSSKDVLARAKEITVPTLITDVSIKGLRPGKQNYALYVYPIRSGASVSAWVTFVMDGSEFASLLTSSLAGLDGSALLYDHVSDQFLLNIQQGEASSWLFQEDSLLPDMTQEEIVRQGQKYVALRSREVANRYRLFTLVPMDRLYAQVYASRSFYNVMLAVIVLLMTLGSAMVAVFNYRPVARLTSSIRGDGTPIPLRADELDVISQYIRHLLQENDSYQEQTAFLSQEQALLSAIQRRDRKAVVQASREMCDYMADHADSRQSIDHLIQGIALQGARDSTDAIIPRESFPTTIRSESPEAFQQRLTSFCLHLIDALDTPVEPAASPTVEEQAAAFIRAHYADPDCTAEAVAEAMHVSLSHLTRLYKASFGVTIVQSIDSLRMERAALLLEQSTEKLSVIVEACGLGSENTFIRKFKRIHGMTPMQYRALHQKGAKPEPVDEEGSDPEG